MAEYKYRALGWKDDDIASLNVVDGTAADNQVELQITKQGAGGTIDGPAIVGKDGITINKAADSEKIEISGSGCVQKINNTTANDYGYVYGIDKTGTTDTVYTLDAYNNGNTIVIRDKNGKFRVSAPGVPQDAVNMGYVDDNYVKKDTTPARVIYAHGDDGKPLMLYPQTKAEANEWWIPTYRYNTEGDSVTGNAVLLTNTPIKPYQCANKKYVDEADKDLRLKLSNLDQALNGYILDTTKEAYADLDSAVLKDSVAVGGNVYPIADKTRALVSRIEGKTTKMVQLLDKSTFPATQTDHGITFTNNGDGTITVNGTATKIVAYAPPNFSMVLGHKYLLIGCPSGGRFGFGYTHSIHQTNSNGKKEYWADDGEGKIFTSVSTSGMWVLAVYTANPTVDNKLFKPNLFDLTAMNREDITTVEQFKAEFPDLYPYENGNIYPAKISGVKFTGKNLFNINQFERYNPNDTSDARVLNDKLLITGYPVNLPNNHYFSNLIRSLKPNTQYAISVNISNYISDSSGSICFIRKNGRDIIYFPFTKNGYSSAVFSLTQEDIDTFDFVRIYGNNETKPPIIMTNLQIEENSAPTAYEPYIEPVSVTLPETYDLHGIGDYKDYLEITKNENNELYTLKKVQVIDKHVFDGTEAWTVSGRVLPICQAFYTGAVKCLFVYKGKGGLSNNLPLATWYDDIEHIQFGQSNTLIYVFLNKEKFKTGSDVQEYLAAQYASGNPLIAYYILPTPVETVIATNLTYEQVTAIRHNGGLIEVEGNTNKGYARPTVTNTIVYRLTASTTVDGTSIVKDTDGKIQLNQEYIDYLDNQLYQPPAISVFTMLDAAGAALPTSNELGTTLSAASFNHQETNIKNIQGDNVELHINNAVAATTSTAKKDVATKVTLTTAQSITSSTKFTLKGTNTKGAAFSRDYQVNFYRYAYTATTDAITAPTSGATQQAAVSTFASNGSTFNYTKGAYIYFYTDNIGKKVQTDVLGQWADVDTTDMGKVTLTQSNGATHEYTCYRIGPFIETGSAKYRV